jgi:Circadian oscillating protein COP23
MHKILANVVSIGCLIGMVSLLPSPVKAEQQPVTRFFCGQSYDPTSKGIVPTTVIATSAHKEPIALIQWKSTAFGEEYTPQTRCQNVSGKLQQAWDTKRFKYLTSGILKRTGQGIICGVKDKKAKCNESTMLFTLISGSNAKEIITRMKGLTAGRSSNPISQSSSDDVVDLQELIE